MTNLSRSAVAQLVGLTAKALRHYDELRGEPREHHETSPEKVHDPSEHVTRLVWRLEPKEE